jgi:hypothetical protein
MANSYKGNPIVLDTFSADVDIALQAFKLSKAPVSIKKVVFHDPTANDIVVLKDFAGNVVVALEADTLNENVSEFFGKCFTCQGLKLIATEQTVTTGKVLIYV